MKTPKTQSFFLLFIYCISAFPQVIQAEPRQQLIEGKLAPCPDKPNCVNTESNDLDAIPLKEFPADKVWHCLKIVVTELGGKFKESENGYFWATFETSILKFTDDVEARLDIQNDVIHLRSASRVGYYDFNVNENRLKKIITVVNRKLIADKMMKKK